jgi:hypothetical protein
MARPTFTPTEAQRETVSVLRFRGWSHERIATALGIAPGTLREHFAPQLDAGALRVEAQILTAVAAKARNGSMAAAKLLLQTTPSRRKRRPKPIGKKEAQVRAALSAGLDTEWGDDLVGNTGETHP